MKSKSVIGGVVAAALFASSAFAADVAPAATPLPAGKPAGAQDAALLAGIPALAVVGGIALVIALVASGTFNDNSNHISAGTQPSSQR